jgi:putative transposase
MPRQLRIEYPGAIYHVMNCGDRREPIFNNGTDRKRFVASLKLKSEPDEQNEFKLL